MDKHSHYVCMGSATYTHSVLERDIIQSIKNHWSESLKLTFLGEEGGPTSCSAKVTPSASFTQNSCFAYRPSSPVPYDYLSRHQYYETTGMLIVELISPRHFRSKSVHLPRDF